MMQSRGYDMMHTFSFFSSKFLTVIPREKYWKLTTSYKLEKPGLNHQETFQGKYRTQFWPITPHVHQMPYQCFCDTAVTTLQYILLLLSLNRKYFIRFSFLTRHTIFSLFNLLQVSPLGCKEKTVHRQISRSKTWKTWHQLRTQALNAQLTFTIIPLGDQYLFRFVLIASSQNCDRCCT